MQPGTKPAPTRRKSGGLGRGAARGLGRVRLRDDLQVRHRRYSSRRERPGPTAERNFEHRVGGLLTGRPPPHGDGGPWNRGASVQQLREPGVRPLEPARRAAPTRLLIAVAVEQAVIAASLPRSPPQETARVFRTSTRSLRHDATPALFSSTVSGLAAARCRGPSGDMGPRGRRVVSDAGHQGEPAGRAPPSAGGAAPGRLGPAEPGAPLAEGHHVIDDGGILCTERSGLAPREPALRGFHRAAGCWTFTRPRRLRRGRLRRADRPPAGAASSRVACAARSRSTSCPGDAERQRSPRHPEKPEFRVVVGRCIIAAPGGQESASSSDGLARMRIGSRAQASRPARRSCATESGRSSRLPELAAKGDTVGRTAWSGRRRGTAGVQLRCSDEVAGTRRGPTAGP